ncbi:MAG: restriction endonuclease subunit S [Eggerthellaceae bacterium]|nr:restriction endonuclease subunit S [Eggerthellaceae bacterium]
MGEFDIKTGPFGSTLHAEDYVASGTPIVTTEHFKSGDLPLTGDGIPQVSDLDIQRLSQYSLRLHDIVFSRVGSVDLNAEVKNEQVGWLFSGRVLRVRPNESIDSTYLHYELGTDRVRNSIVERAVGLTMASINTGILGDTEFVAPTKLEEQRRIGALFSSLDNLITLHQRGP